ncbi:MAG: exodeoxyribonuclease VII large subunit [Clostridia bacterium]|nr:exodeoxyribonuclease VII large subunit [Clostridia bacterium]
MITPTPTVYSVNELNTYVKQILDNDDNLKYIFVTGEISNYKAHYSGHLYMTLKDEKATVKAVMFAGNASKLRFRPENGMKVLAFGTVSLFPRDGSYQLYISDMQPDGIGALNIAYEQLKKKLEAEGLFSPRYKKPIPEFPERVGVITSATGAAVQDIFNVLSRRYPLAEVVLRPAKVQGDGAAEDIAQAIKTFNELNAADVLIVGRGGGSIEDLWAFNEEVVARAVFESHIPVISAVGHETDYTICDFVADLRAPTPSAAAEIAVPDKLELKSELISYKQHLLTIVKTRITNERTKIKGIEQKDVMCNPLAKITENRRELVYMSERLGNLTAGVLDENKRKFAALAGKLDALSPVGVISRGYALVESDGRIVTSKDDVSTGDSISLKVSDGVINAEVLNVNEG